MHLDDVAIDGQVILLTTGLLVLTSVLVCLAPVLATPSISSGLSSAPVHTTTRRERRFRRVFVVVLTLVALQMIARGLRGTAQ